MNLLDGRARGVLFGRAGVREGSRQPRISLLLAKIVVATSGVLLASWTLLHMLGTLSVLAGPETMNGYARLLRQAPAALWGMRIGLFLLLFAHVALTLSLLRAARRARPEGYRGPARHRGTLASRTMKLTGPLLGIWLVHHVLSMYGVLGGEHRPADVYFNLVSALDSFWVNLSYVAATLIFGQHLWHGLRSSLQTLGLSVRVKSALEPVCLLLVIGLCIGFVAPSIGVLAFGLSQAP